MATSARVHRLLYALLCTVLCALMWWGLPT